VSAEELYGAALALADRAYAPYSGVRVGAVIEDADGRRHGGVNVECASYGLSLCAERSALARAVGEGAMRPARMAVARAGGEPIAPCGACRQALAEFGLGVAVVYRGPNGLVERRLDELLADAFLLPGAAGAPG
jgi:cytidine deaminase